MEKIKVKKQTTKISVQELVGKVAGILVTYKALEYALKRSEEIEKDKAISETIKSMLLLGGIMPVGSLVYQIAGGDKKLMSKIYELLGKMIKENKSVKKEALK